MEELISGVTDEGLKTKLLLLTSNLKKSKFEPKIEPMFASIVATFQSWWDTKKPNIMRELSQKDNYKLKGPNFKFEGIILETDITTFYKRGDDIFVDIFVEWFTRSGSSGERTYNMQAGREVQPAQEDTSRGEGPIFHQVWTATLIALFSNDDSGVKLEFIKGELSQWWYLPANPCCNIWDEYMGFLSDYLNLLEEEKKDKVETETEILLRFINDARKSFLGIKLLPHQTTDFTDLDVGIISLREAIASEKGRECVYEDDVEKTCKFTDLEHRASDLNDYREVEIKADKLIDWAIKYSESLVREASGGGKNKKSKRSKRHQYISKSKTQKKTQKGGRKLKKIKKRIHKSKKMNTSRGKNKALEKLWTDMSNMKKYVYIMKDGSYQIKSVEPSYKGQRGSDFHHKYCLPMIEKANNDDSVKAILTAGNSFDGYEQLYDDVGRGGSPSVDQVLKDYKKYWKYQIDGKLYTC